MTEQVEIKSPQAVANELEISPATLRRWSDEFADYLSVGAGTTQQGRSHRRYLDSDLETLTMIKELMSDGMTYEQVRLTLNGQVSVSVQPDMIKSLQTDDEDGDPDLELPDAFGPANDGPSNSLVASNGESPAIAFLTNTLSTLSDSQKSILNSQAANRELLGVLLQDNFNLKEENNRLRERILEVEREVSHVRQEEDWKREALRRELDAKIVIATQTANEAVIAANSIEVPEIKTIESNPGCLGRLLGITNQQVVTVSRKKGENKLAAQQSGRTSTGQMPSIGANAANYPKPLFPPE